MQATLPALVTIGHLIAFVGVGLFLRRRFRFLDSHPSADDALLIWGLSALAGYATFWLYFLDLRLGVAVAVILSVAGFAELFLSLWRQMRARVGLVEEQKVELLVLGVAFLYLGILYLVPLGLDAGHVAESRFMGGIPLDNLLPGIFADRLWEGVDPRGFPNGWLSSDRPPLQAGILLLQRPLAVTFSNVVTSDLILGIIAQLAWIPAVWSASRAMGQSRKTGGLVLAFTIFSGFVFFNSVFVWPKLLAGAFAVGSIAQFLRARFESRRLVRSEWLVAAALAGLALLSHAGVAFTLIGFAAVLPLFRAQLDVKGLAMAVLTGALLLAPWFAYQKFYEPPANRLLKWHIGGSSGIDDRSFSEVFLDNYGSRTAAEIAALKLGNLRVLFGDEEVEPGLVGIRGFEFRYFFPSFGVLSIGWLALLVRPKRMTRMIWLLAAIVVSAIVAWIVLIFGPAWTLAPHGSLGTTILVCLLLGSAICSLDPRVTTTVLTIQVIAFLVVWVSPIAADRVWRTMHDISWAAVVVAIVGALTIVGSLRSLASVEESAVSAG